MKPVLLALTLAALSMTVVGIALLVTAERERPPVAWRDPGAGRAATVPVLSGAAAGVEVLVRDRFSVADWRAFADRALERSLGVEEGRFGFLEMVAINGGESPVRVHPAGMSLCKRDGEEVPVTPLETLAARSDGAVVRTQIAALAPDPNVPLAPGTMRRTLVAIPRGITVSDLGAGQIAGVELAPGRALSDRLDAHVRRPRAGLLVAVLDEVPESESGGGAVGTKDESGGGESRPEEEGR